MNLRRVAGDEQEKSVGSNLLADSLSPIGPDTGRTYDLETARISAPHFS